MKNTTSTILAIVALSSLSLLSACSKGKNGGLEWKNTGKWADCPARTRR